MTLSCLWLRRRVVAYVDRALPESQAQGVARHLRSCAGCRQWAEGQEQLTALVRGAAAEGAEPEWAGFWSGIRTRLAAEGSAARRSVGRSRPAWSLGWLPRLALGSAVAGLLVVGVFLWRGNDQVEVPAPGIVVRTVEVSNPNTSVMVFAPPEQEMTVIWVFGLDTALDQSRRQSEEVRQGWRFPSWSVPSWV